MIAATSAGPSRPALPFFQGALRRRLLFLGLGLLGVTLVVNTIAGSYYTRRLILKGSGELQAELAARVAFEIEEFMDGKLTRLVDFAASASLHGPASERQKMLALLLLKNDPAFKELAIVDGSGREILKVSETRLNLPGELRDRSRAEEFDQAFSGETYVSPVYTSDRAEPYVTLAVPIRLSPREIIGVVVAETNLKALWDVVRNIRFGGAGYAYLVDRKGNLIAHPDSSLVLRRLNLAHVPEVLEFLNSPFSRDEHPAKLGRGITGESVLSTYAPVKSLGWAVVLAEPFETALAEITTMAQYAALLVAVGLGVGALVIVWVSNRITNPIRTLHGGAQRIAAGDLDYRVDVKSGDEIEELADEFNKMALELKNSYSSLERNVELRTRELAALYEVTTAVNQTLELPSILDAVIAKITEMFRFESTRIFLFDESNQYLELQASFEQKPEASRGVRRFSRGQGIVGRVGATAEPLIFEDVETDPRYQALSTSRTAHVLRHRFFAVFPIKTRTRVVGVITFTGAAPRKLGDDEVRMLTSMTEHLGVAVEKVRLFREAEKRSQHLALLNGIGGALSRSLDLNVVFDEAVTNIATRLGFDAVWIYRLGAADGQLHLRAHKGLSDSMAAELAVRPVSIGISGEVIRRGRPMIFEDIKGDQHYHELSRAGKVVSLGFETAAAFPISTKERTIGTLHVANRSKRRFPEDEVRLIESIAQVIGVAVENAELFAEVNRKSSELLQANRELTEATRAKSEFIAAMSHELRTPLNIIIGSTDLTRDGFFGEINAEQKDALQKVSRNARVLLKMINDLLTLSRIEAKKMTLDVSTFDVREVIAHARTYVEQINRDKRLEVLWDVDADIPPVVSDALKLEEILQNLIGNAFKFTPAGRVEVQVRHLDGTDRVQFAVADTGIGIGEEDLGRIFNEFEQIKEAHTGDFNGVGLGLSIVKKYLDLMQGEIRVQSHPGQGSTFTFWIPRNLPLHS
ncbi:MAG TPA: GAF domain-containing protein [candidate division Zixibacteria bacterium]|nr:GAF domain-containing protein [candidate division Zixibacteria bacterium]